MTLGKTLLTEAIGANDGAAQPFCENLTQEVRHGFSA